MLCFKRWALFLGKTFIKYGPYKIKIKFINLPIWSIDRYEKRHYLSDIFWITWKTGAEYQTLFKFSNLLQLLYNQFCQLSTAWNSEYVKIKTGKYQLLKTDRSRYIVILLKS